MVDEDARAEEQEQPPTLNDYEEQARRACDRPGLERGVNFFDFYEAERKRLGLDEW